MLRQKILFWCLVAAFLAAAFLYTASIFMRSNPTVDFSRSISEYETKGVPDFTLPVFDTAKAAPSGERVRLYDSKANVIILNFWASWCGPCVVEFPSLVELSQKYKDDPRLQILAVAVDSDLGALQSFVAGAQKPSARMAILTDAQGQVASKFGTSKLPETYIIGKDHKLIRKVISAQNWMSPSFLKFLEQEMGRAH